MKYNNSLSVYKKKLTISQPSSAALLTAGSKVVIDDAGVIGGVDSNGVAGTGRFRRLGSE
jgi:hypothetical protein